nr:hypothetical protein [Marinicella sp. W31]MDC2875696.1 hypothetical protein [Marinicella sp. W31]
MIEIAGALDQQVVDADRAELIDDDSRIAERRVFQQTVEECRLASAEKAGDDRYGNRCGRIIHEQFYWAGRA